MSGVGAWGASWLTEFPRPSQLGKHEMKTVRRCVGPPVIAATATTLLMSLVACAEQPTEPQAPRAANVVINVDDVEQIPIQEVSARERAAREARRCGGAGRGGCDSDEDELITDPIFGPGSDF